MQAIQNLFFWWWQRVLVRYITLFIVIFLLFILLTMNAQPGGLLYPLKVSGIERVASHFRVGVESQSLYQQVRLERRLHEAVKLSSRKNVSESAVEKLSVKVVSVTRKWLDHLARNEGGELSPVFVLLATHQMEIRLKAIERVFRENDSFKSEAQKVISLRREVSDYLDSRSNQLLLSKDGSFTNVFTSLLESLMSELNRERLDEEALMAVQDYVLNAQVLLTEEDFNTALRSLFRAVEIVELVDMGLR